MSPRNLERGEKALLTLRDFYQKNFICQGLMSKEQAQAEILLILEDCLKIEQRQELLKLLIVGSKKEKEKEKEKEKYFLEREKLEEIKRKRKQRIPLQYIQGRAYFLGLELIINESTLIPRPETELLVELAQEELKVLSRARLRSSKELKILEIGTGSGCLSIGIAKSLLEKEKISKFKIKATDISAKTLEVALINLKKYNLEKFIELEEVNLLSKKDSLKSWDLIVANPPYLKTSEYQELTPEVKKEPKIALVAEQGDGLSFYQRFQELNLNYWRAIFEINQTLYQETEKIFQRANLDTKLYKDYSGNFRFLKIR